MSITQTSTASQLEVAVQGSHNDTCVNVQVALRRCSSECLVKSASKPQQLLTVQRTLAKLSKVTEVESRLKQVVLMLVTVALSFFT